MRRLLFTAAAAACLASPGLSVPAIAQSSPAVQSSLPVLHIGLADDADLLDPTLARTFVGRIVFAGLCDKLVDINAKLQIVPQLATSWDWVNSTTLVMHLRPGVLFQDGTKMDAAAVKYSLERDLNLPGSSRRGEISTMDHVDVVDPLTVRIVLKSPTAPFLAALTDRAGMILSPKAAEAEGKDFSLHPVCAGPFSFKERVAQDHITLDRFPGYWNAKAIHFSQVIYRTIVDPSVRLANLEAGSLDLAERIAPTDIPAVRKDHKLKLDIYDGLGYQGITFNVGHGPASKTPLGEDARVRQAFALAIDRKALVQVVYNGMFSPTAQGVPPASPYYDAQVQPQPRNVAKAKALLKAAGVKLPVQVELTVTDSATQQQEGEVIQSMAAAAGFNVKLRATEFSTSLDADDRGDFMAHLIGWSGRTDPDGNLYSFLHTGAPLNVGYYSNKEVDSLLTQAREVLTVPARKALYDRLAVKSQQDLPIMYLYVPKVIDVMSAKLDGFVPVPDGMLRLQGVTLAK